MSYDGFGHRDFESEARERSRHVPPQLREAWLDGWKIPTGQARFYSDNFVQRQYFTQGQGARNQFDKERERSVKEFAKQVEVELNGQLTAEEILEIKTKSGIIPDRLLEKYLHGKNWKFISNSEIF